jgi:hypothetical protein
MHWVVRASICIPVIFFAYLGSPEVAQWCVVALATLGLLDFVYASKTPARWFILHTAGNACVAIFSTVDLYRVVTDPLNVLKEKEASHIPTGFVLAIHAYHVCGFSNLNWVDWVHHGLMVGLALPLVIISQYGPLMNYNNWFVCGVPGGLDYLMLTMVKLKMMEPLAEKRLNTLLNVWMRCPFLLFSSLFSYLQFFLQEDLPNYVIAAKIGCMVLQTWNALYFTERVVGNYHVCIYKDSLSKKKGAPGTGVMPPKPVMQSEEHLLPSVPGFQRYVCAVQYMFVQ